MAINKRKRNHSDNVAAGRGVRGRPRGAVRTCTLDMRLEQLEDKVVADWIRHQTIEEKLNQSVDQAEFLRKEVQQLKD